MKLFKGLMIALFAASALTACTERSEENVLDQPGEAFEENIGEPAQEGFEDTQEGIEDLGE